MKAVWNKEVCRRGEERDSTHPHRLTQILTLAITIYIVVHKMSHIRDIHAP